MIDFEKHIKDNYPWINNENAKHLISQAGYYAWHEGLIPETKWSIKDKLIMTVIILVIITIGIIIFCL